MTRGFFENLPPNMRASQSSFPLRFMLVSLMPMPHVYSFKTPWQVFVLGPLRNSEYPRKRLTLFPVLRLAETQAMGKSWKANRVVGGS